MKKKDTKLDVLCKGFPQEFQQYISYCRNLKFDEKPDYAYCISLFARAMESLQYENDFLYDWSTLFKK